MNSEDTGSLQHFYITHDVIVAIYGQDGGETARSCSYLCHDHPSGTLAKGSDRVSIPCDTSSIVLFSLRLIYNNKKRLKRETAKVGLSQKLEWCERTVGDLFVFLFTVLWVNESNR